jgi:hypothetical protein
MPPREYRDPGRITRTEGKYRYVGVELSMVDFRRLEALRLREGIPRAHVIRRILRAALLDASR